MFLKHLEINNFRNYTNLSLDFDSKVNIIIGDNAQGKTNLLEAVYFLGLVKSHRTSNINSIIKNDCDVTNISGILVNQNGELQLFIGLNQNEKKLKIDNQIVKKISDYASNMNVILFSPDDLDLIKGNPEARRKYLNNEICQISSSYFNILDEYNKLLKMKNDYLLNYKKFDDNYYDILNNYLVDRSINIYKYRKNFVEKINKNVSSIFKYITNYDNFYINYVPNLDVNYEMPNLKEEIKRIYSQNKEKEKSLRKVLVGPHRDDIQFMLSDIDLKYYGSQGQQRMAIISLKLAEISIFFDIKKTTPIILLDDVFSELDDEKKNRLLKFIDCDSQVIITTTDLNNISKDIIKSANILKITEGNLEEVEIDGTK